MTDEKLKALLEQYELAPQLKRGDNVNRFLAHIGEYARMWTYGRLTSILHRNLLHCRVLRVISYTR